MIKMNINEILIRKQIALPIILLVTYRGKFLFFRKPNYILKEQILMIKLKSRKNLIVTIMTGIMIFSAFISESIPLIEDNSVLSVSAVCNVETWKGGRRVITLSGAQTVNYRFSHNTWIEMHDDNWNLIWSGSKGPSLFGTFGNLKCGSDVRYVSFYLDDDKEATVYWS